MVATDGPPGQVPTGSLPRHGARDHAGSGPRGPRQFVGLPYRLHAGTPWIPPLKLERYVYLSRMLNPFFKHGDAEYFLARRDGRVVGRITAQIDRHFNEFHDNRWGLFGFLEFEDDQEIVDGLLAAAEGGSGSAPATG